MAKYLKNNAVEGYEDGFDDDEAFDNDEIENNNQVDPRWEALKKLTENN